MASLTELREQLDAVDDEIVKLFEKRMDLCGQVENIKFRMEERSLTASGRVRS